MMRVCSIVLVCMCLLAAMPVKSQYRPESIPKELRDLYDLSYEHARYGEVDRAMELLHQIVQKQPAFLEARLARAGIFNRQRNYTESIKDYEFIKKTDAIFFRNNSLAYAHALGGLGRFTDALNVVNEYLKNPALSEASKKNALAKKDQYQFAIQQSKQPYQIVLENLGDGVNSAALEYYPSFPIEDNKIIFTRRTGNTEDFYESEWINGKWSKAKPLAGKINTLYNEGAQNISADGQWLVYAGCDYPEGIGSCDLYISVRNSKNEWSESYNLGDVINTRHWESAPVFSSDKQELYFISNRPGGYGGKDMYVSRLQPDGEWGAPKNMGPVINTKGDEESPFLHADNETLYFTSNGHLGYGNRDLFVSRRTDSGWSKPENLGYPINTVDDDGALVVAADGVTAYYATDAKGGQGSLDLFSFKLPARAAANKTTWIKGTVYDAITKKPIQSTVHMQDVRTKILAEKSQTDTKGKFLVTLPVDRLYAFNVSEKGYLLYSEQFLIKRGRDSAQTIEIFLQPIGKGAKVTLKNLFFETNKSQLNQASFFELDKVLEFMQQNPTVRIGIYGHTDNVGKPADNMKLSTDRSNSVAQYLIGRGIEAQRIISKGMGETQPAASNNTEDGRAKNRRTELVIL